MDTKDSLATSYVGYQARLPSWDPGTDPTLDTVRFTFPSRGVKPDSGSTWTAGSWISLGTQRKLYFALTPLLGPGAGGLAIALGEYDVWIRVTAVPQDIIEYVGPLSVV